MNLYYILYSAVLVFLSLDTSIYNWWRICYRDILHVVVGEMAPKTIAIQKAEYITLLFAKPIIFFYKLMYPFIWLLNGAARLILKMFNMKPAKESEVFHSEEELKQLIHDSHEGGEINDSELHHINQAFKFDNLVAKDIMIDEEHVKTLNLNTRFDDAIQQIKIDAFTRYPAVKDDQIVGFIHSKSLFNVEQPSKLETFVNPIINVKMNTPLKHILEMMKREKCISQQFIMTLISRESLL